MKQSTNLTRCPSGHFYDANKFKLCPHCNNKEEITETVYIPYCDIVEKHNPVVDNNNVASTQAEQSESKPKLKEEKPLSDAPEIINKKANITVKHFEHAMGTNPAVGWLVCIKGAHFGIDFKIESGRNFIGRADNMHICLNADKTVSRDRHAILTYDPKTISFIIQPGDSDKLFYVNGDVVLVPTKLSANDRVLIGDCEFVFIPFCSKEFSW